MNIDYLVAYYHVITTGSFSEASRKLHISQPGISFQIKNLEKEIGLPLVDYKNKKLHLTDAGKRLFRFAEYIYFEQINLKRDMEQLRKELTGDLSIIASRVPAEFILPAIVGDFKKQYPSIGTKISISDSDKVIQDLINGNYEVGFCSILPESPILDNFAIAKEEVVIIVSPIHPLARFNEVSLSELSGESLITRVDTWENQRDPINLLAHDGFDISQFKFKLVLGTNTGIITAVESGAGIAFMSDLAIKATEASGKIKTLKIKGATIGREFYCVYRNDREDYPVLKEFIHFVKSKKL